MHFNISDTPLSISMREQAQRMENVIWMNDHVCVCVCVCVYNTFSAPVIPILTIQKK